MLYWEEPARGPKKYQAIPGMGSFMVMPVITEKFSASRLSDATVSAISVANNDCFTKKAGKEMWEAKKSSSRRLMTSSLTVAWPAS